MCKVYYDKDGWFLIKLIEGTKNGINVLDLIQVLCEVPQKSDGTFDFAVLYNECRDAKKACEDIEKLNLGSIVKVFPCVIIVRKKFLKKWWTKCVEQIEYYEKVKITFEKVVESAKKGWITKESAECHKNCLDNEINRLKKLEQTIKSYNQILENHTEGLFSFFNNSSIWIRLVDWNEVEINNAINEFKYFESIGLYHYGNAKENLDYNIRIQEHNFLDNTAKGHGNFVTPVLYGDERKSLEILVNNHQPLNKNDK